METEPSPFKRGEWVQYKGRFARVHGASKGGRHLIEVQSNLNKQVVIFREWVEPLSVTVLDPAVSDLLTSIYEV